MVESLKEQRKTGRGIGFQINAMMAFGVVLMQDRRIHRGSVQFHKDECDMDADADPSGA